MANSLGAKVARRKVPPSHQPFFGPYDPFIQRRVRCHDCDKRICPLITLTIKSQIGSGDSSSWADHSLGSTIAVLLAFTAASEAQVHPRCLRSPGRQSHPTIVQHPSEFHACRTTSAFSSANSCETCRQCPIHGVDCIDANCGRELNWKASRPLPWQVFAQGEYIGPHRNAHVPEYRLRVDDEVRFVYRLTREVSGQAYRLNVGDRIRIESLADENLDRELVIQPDGTITIRLLGQVMAAGLTLDDLRKKSRGAL